MGHVLELLKEPQWGSLDVYEDPDWPSVSIEELGVTINFQDGYANSIQLSFLIDENDEVVWPER